MGWLSGWQYSEEKSDLPRWKREDRKKYMREYMRKRRQDPEFRAKMNERRRIYYWKHRDEERKRNREWERKNKERRRIYKRQNILTTNSGRLSIKKREFEGFCELCGVKIDFKPNWHHWDDKHPEKGLWLCGKCHWLAESVEYDPNYQKMELYKKLKATYNGMALGI